MTIVVETKDLTDVIQTRGQTVVEDRGGGRVNMALGVSKKFVILAVPPATPTIVDSVPIADAQSVKWFVTLLNGSDVRGYREIAATDNTGTAQFVGTHAIRDVPFTIDVNVVGGNYELEITSGDAGPVDIHIIRIA